MRNIAWIAIAISIKEVLPRVWLTGKLIAHEAGRRRKCFHLVNIVQMLAEKINDIIRGMPVTDLSENSFSSVSQTVLDSRSIH